MQSKERAAVKVKIKDPDQKKVYHYVIVCSAAVAQVARADLEQPDMLNFIFRDQKGRQLAQVKVKISP